MATLELLTLFLASPGDVTPEREVARRVVEEYNRSVGRIQGVRVEVIGWDTDARPAWGKDGQALINEQIVDQPHTLFVGILWNRFGTPTPRANSGTEEEFNLALEAHRKTGMPEIMLYFGTASSSFNSQHELDQKSKVLNFKSGIDEGLYWTFDSTAKFEEEFRRHYGQWLQNTIKNISTSSVTPKAD